MMCKGKEPTEGRSTPASRHFTWPPEGLRYDECVFVALCESLPGFPSPLPYHLPEDLHTKTPPACLVYPNLDRKSVHTRTIFRRSQTSISCNCTKERSGHRIPCSCRRRPSELSRYRSVAAKRWAILATGSPLSEVSPLLAPKGFLPLDALGKKY